MEQQGFDVIDGDTMIETKEPEQDQLSTDNITAGNLDDTGEDTTDYKSKYEEIAAQKNKIAKDFQDVQSQRDRFESALLKKISSENPQYTPAADRPAQGQVSIDDQIKALKNLYNTNEMDLADFTEQIADLKATQIADKKEKEILARQNQKSQELTKQQIDEKYTSLINNHFPDINRPDSPLIKEAMSLMREYPEIYGDAAKNLVQQFALLQAANVKVGGGNPRQQQVNQSTARSAHYSTNTSGAYNDSGDANKAPIFTQNQIQSMRETGLMDSDIKRLAKSNPHFGIWSKNADQWRSCDPLPDMYLDMHSNRR